MWNYLLSGKAMIICLIVGYIKKISLCNMSYYPEPDSHIENKIKVELQTWTKSSRQIHEIK